VKTSERIENPYPGLRPFDFSESHLFFGREGRSEELLLKLTENRFVAVAGTSGSGKSSLVRAGLLPLLYGGFMSKAGPRWRVAVFRPGKDPIYNMASALNSPRRFEPRYEEIGASGEFALAAGASPSDDSRHVSGGKRQTGRLPFTDEDIKCAAAETILRRSALGLVEYVRRARMEEGENLLLVVDQFEELFRFRDRNSEAGGAAQTEDDAAAFVKLLLEAVAEPSVPVYVTLTMRSDYLGDCAQFRDLPEAINKSQYLIPRMSREQQRDAIVCPASVRGVALTPRLVQRLLIDAGDKPEQLPLMQHALMRTWDYWAEVGAGGDLDVEQYEFIGGMAEALSRHAQETYESLPDERAKAIAEKLFKALTLREQENREVRRPTELGEVRAIADADSKEIEQVINHFRAPGRSFLMPPPDVELTDDTLLDISHESLIRGWKTLATWVEQEAKAANIYSLVADAARRYERGKGELWRDADLKFALDWRDETKPNEAWARRYQPGLQRALDFITDSESQRDIEIAEEEHRTQRQLELERSAHAAAQELTEAKRKQEETEKLRALEEKRVALLESERAMQQAEEQKRIAELERERTVREARSARKLRYALAAAILMFLLATGTAAYAFKQNKEVGRQKAAAVDAKEEADTQAKNARELARQLKTALTEQEQISKQLDSEKQRAEKEAKRATALAAEAEVQEKRANMQAAFARTKAAEAERATDVALRARVQVALTLREREATLSELQKSYEELKVAQANEERARKKNNTNREAMLLVQTGELSGAEEKFKEVEALEESATGADADVDGKSFVKFNLGSIYRQQSRFDEAETAYKSSIGLHEKGSRKTVASLDHLAHLYAEQGRFKDSKEAYEQLTSILDKPKAPENAAPPAGAKPSDSAGSSDNESYLRHVYNDQGELYSARLRELDADVKATETEIRKAAEPILQPQRPKPPAGETRVDGTRAYVLSLTERIGMKAACGLTDKAVADLCAKRDALLKERDDAYKSAEGFFRKALEVNTREPGGDLAAVLTSPTLLPIYDNLSQFYSQATLGSKTYNKSYYFKSLVSRLKEVNSQGSAKKRDPLTKLTIARSFQRADEFAAAEALYLSVVRGDDNSGQYRSSLREAYRGLAQIKNEQAKAKNDKSYYDEAEVYYRKALAVVVPPPVAPSLSAYDGQGSLEKEVSNFFEARGNYDEALRNFMTVVDAERELVKNAETPVSKLSLATYLDRVSDLLRKKNDIDGAINNKAEAQKIYEANYGAENYHNNPSMVELADLYMARNNFDKARQFYERVRENSLKNLKAVTDRRKSSKDDDEYSRLRNYYERRVGVEMAYYVTSLDRLAAISIVRNGGRDAERYYAEAVKNFERLNTLEYASPSFAYRRELYKAYVRTYEDYANFLSKTRRPSPVDLEARIKEFKEYLSKTSQTEDDGLSYDDFVIR
jgi:tetratricopeptide (TPR) repeat protein